MPLTDIFEIRKGLILSFLLHLFIAFSLSFLGGSTINFRVEAPLFYVDLGEFSPRSSLPKVEKQVRVSSVPDFRPVAPSAPASEKPPSLHQANGIEEKEAVAGGDVTGEIRATGESHSVGSSAPVLRTTDAKSLLGEGSHMNAIPEAPMGARWRDFEAPAFLHREMPEYPPLAQRMGKEGKVVLALTIDHIGELKGIEVLQGADYGFTEAAIKAVKKSTFLPARKNGQAVSSRALLIVRFQLD